MPDDFGYFGKGIAGYTHYMEAFNRNNGGKKPPRGGKANCLTTLSFVFLFFMTLALILR